MLIALLREDANTSGSDLVGLIADGLAAEFMIDHFDFVHAVEHARRAIETARAIGATFYAHFFVMWLGIAVRGADSVTARDLELIGLSLREQRDAGQEADQWLVLVGAACALGDVTIAVAVHDGLLGSQWANSALAEALPGFFAQNVDRAGSLDQPGSSDRAVLGPLVDRVLATVDERLERQRD